MNRRKLFKYGSISAAGITLTSLGLNFRSQVLGQKEQKIYWDYDGKEGPENWSKLSSDYRACGYGATQSPINISSAIDSDLAKLETNYQNSPLRILNNGHTIQVNYQPGSTLVLDNQSYELVQFHFHHPSEHQVSKQNYPMELHLVHKNSQGNLAVLGVFLKQGRENAALKPIWSALPMSKSPDKLISGVTVNAVNLLPENKDYYRYYGSLTTPPCSETVNWIVYKEPIEVSPTQLQQFAKIFPMNARPVQQLKRRFLLQSS